MSPPCTEAAPPPWIRRGAPALRRPLYIEQTGDDMVSCTPSVVDGAQLTVSVSARVPTIFLGLFGVNSFTMKASATAQAIEGT